MAKKLIVPLAFLAAAVIVGAFILRSSLTVTEEDRIRRQLSELIELLEKDGEETPVRLHSINRRMPEFFENPSRIMISEAGLSGHYSPRELASYAVRLRTGFEVIEMTFGDLTIEITEAGLARADFSLEVRGRYRGERGMRDFFEVNATLKLVDNEWLFSSVEIVDVLRK